VPQLAIVMTAGNHDSPGRLEAPAPLLSVFDASVIGHVGRQGDLDAALGRLLVPLKDAAGREAAWCIAMPFLRPDDLPRVEGPTTPTRPASPPSTAAPSSWPPSGASPGRPSWRSATATWPAVRYPRIPSGAS
jgi:hypothetical protein